MSFVFDWIKSQEFAPSTLGMLVNPSYLIRSQLAKTLQRWSPQMHGTMLDFGCGTSPYRKFFEVDTYLGLEIVAPGHPDRSRSANLQYSGEQIPLADLSVDCVLMTEVLEHVFNPAEVLIEFHRILRPDGKVLITCPFVWPLHEEPYDYARYTPYALRHLASNAGLEVVAIERTGSWCLVLAQLLIQYVVQMTCPSDGRLNRLGKIFWCTLLNPLAIIADRIFPSNDQIYFNNILVLRKASISS